jgi:arabinose-5-phosphate isomerase
MHVNPEGEATASGFGALNLDKTPYCGKFVPHIGGRPGALAHTAGEIMNAKPMTIAPEAFEGEALALMEARKITSLIVVAPSGEVLGVVHLQDLWASALP